MANLLTERFDGTIDDWTALDEADATTSGPGVWVLRTEDDVQQSSNIFGSDDLPRVPGTFFTYDLGASWTLYTMTLRINSTDNDNIGFMVYYQDVNNYIQYRTASQAGEGILWQKVAGVQTELASETFTYISGKWYDYEIEVTATTVTVSRDGADLFGGSVNHTGPASGTVGLYCSGNQSGFFDTVIVDENVAPVIGLTAPHIAQSGASFNAGIARIF